MKSGAPLITQSDKGTENYSVANIQTLIRQRLDPTLRGTLQHRWVVGSTHNVKPEAFWSYLRQHFMPGFENILQQAVNTGLYDPNSPLDRSERMHIHLARFLTIIQAHISVASDTMASVRVGPAAI